MTYLHKDESEVKEGDLCFYTESPDGKELRYADSVQEIVKVGDTLRAKTLYFISAGAITKNPWARYTDLNPIELKHCTGDTERTLIDFTKLDIDLESLDLKYVKSNFPTTATIPSKYLAKSFKVKK